MEFEVYSARYEPTQKRLHFAARGLRDGVRFSVVADVKCLRDPVTPENVHLVVLVRLNEIFKRRSASGR